MLKPLGHRLLVQPDAQPDQTESGILLPQDHDHVPVSGTVVAVGPGGSQLRYQARQRAIKDCCEIVESALTQFGHLAALRIVRDEIAGLLGSSDPQREVQVGDRVAYPVECGLKVTEDGAEFVILNEDDVAVIVIEQPQEAVA